MADYKRQGSIDDENFLYLADKIDGGNDSINTIGEEISTKLQNIKDSIDGLNISEEIVKDIKEKLTEIDDDIEQLNSDLYYKPGDIISQTDEAASFPGNVQTSGTVVTFQYPLAKPLSADISSASIDISMLTFMTISGRIAISDLSVLTDKTVSRRTNYLRVTLTNSDGWGITNYTPVVVQFTGTITFS